MTGIYEIHARKCESKATPKGRCNCKPTFQAWVPARCPGEKPIRRNFATKTEAKNWRADAVPAVKAGQLRARTTTTVTEAGEALLAGMREGTLMNRSGRPYKPSTVRRYEEALRVHVKPELGHMRLSSVDRAHVKAMVRQWVRAGMAPSSVRNNIDPLRVIFREAIEDGQVGVDPIAKLRLPHGGGRRERVADRVEAQTLIEALAENERALWACAFYGTLRRGELRALRWSDVDFEAGVIHVVRGWDDKDGEQTTKSDAGERDVPLAGVLRKLLVAHKLASGRGGDDLVFGRTEALPFTSSTVGIRAMRAWGWKQVKNAESVGPRMTWMKAREDALTPITLHEARHSAASYLIEAGLNDLELTAVVGHSDSRTTKNIYGHLFPDSAAAVAAKMDAYHGVEAAG
jgi:integrase